jgi:hypothetical protein
VRARAASRLCLISTPLPRMSRTGDYRQRIELIRRVAVEEISAIGLSSLASGTLMLPSNCCHVCVKVMSWACPCDPTFQAGSGGFKIICVNVLPPY